MNESDTTTAEANPVHWSLNPGVVAAVFVALFIASLVPVTLLVSDTHFPDPLQPPNEITAYFQAEAFKVRVCAFLQFCSAIIFGVFTALMFSRLWYHRANAVSNVVTFVGGLATTFLVGLSALIQWTVTQPGIADTSSLTLALYYLLVSAGGVGFSVPFGLFAAGISVSAGVKRQLPKWLIVFGVIISIIGELSVLYLVIPNALHLIPLTRFPGFVWMIFAGFKLPNLPRFCNSVLCRCSEFLPRRSSAAFCFTALRSPESILRSLAGRLPHSFSAFHRCRLGRCRSPA